MAAQGHHHLASAVWLSVDGFSETDFEGMMSESAVWRQRGLLADAFFEPDFKDVASEFAGRPEV